MRPSKYGCRVEESSPGRRHVERLDLGTLVGRAHDVAIGIETSVGYNNAVPWSCELSVERIWRLEPRAGESPVQVQRVGGRKLIIQPIEEIALG